MKKLLSLFLSLILILSAACAAFAFDEEETQKMAEELEEQGLLSGVGKNDDGTTNFALHRAMTRQEAVVMLIAILGRLDDAKAAGGTSPFTDVDDWAQPFVAYACENDYAAGYPDGQFRAHSDVTANQYLTFVLKALGYDASSDFDWTTAWLLTDNLGITAGEYTEENNQQFLRGDAIRCAYKALSFVCTENLEVTDGLENLQAEDAIPAELRASEEYQGLEGIVEIAEQYLGVAYKTAGKTPEGFDCSGFVIYVLKEYGLDFDAACCQDLYGLCEPVDEADLKVGDLVFFTGTYATGNISHVGIYIGNGQMIHASSGYHGCVCITDVMDSYWSLHFNSYGRMSQL